MTTAELSSSLDDARVSAGLDERLDRAGARAHGHDVDGRAHARRGARRRGRSGAARRARRRRRGRRGALPGTRSAVFEGLGGETPRWTSSWTRRRWRAGTSIRRAPARSPTSSRRAARSARSRRPSRARSARCRCAWRSTRPGCTSRRRTCSGMRRCAPAATGRRAAGAARACSDGRRYVRRPGDAAHGARRAVRVRLRRPQRGDRSRRLRRARARRRRRRAPRGCGRVYGPASASSGPGSTSCSWPDSGGWR